MRKATKRTLREIARQEIAQFYKYGKCARSSEVWDTIKSEHPDLIVQMSAEMVDAQGRRLCADEMKEWQTVSNDGARQLFIPGLEPQRTEHLPPAISIPIDGNPQDILFVPAAIATLDQWMAHLALLKKQHGAIGVTIRAIEELVTVGADCPKKTPLVQWMSQRAPQAAMAA
jgi:hypothetical protein